MKWILLLISACISVLGKVSNTHLHYPMKFVKLDGLQYYYGNLTSNELTCFENDEFSSKSYLNNLLCLTYLSPWSSCTSLWGSRSVMLKVFGSAEFVKLFALPNTLGVGYNTLRVSNWMNLKNIDHESSKEFQQIPAEPIVICGRNNHPATNISSVEISLRHTYIRDRDRRSFFDALFYHIVLIFASSSMWLLPYILAVAVAIFSYTHGIKVLMMLLMGSLIIVSLFPIMLMKKNRDLMKLYIRYFFSRRLADETKQLIKLQRPLFQALYFSCFLLHVGSISSYLVYHYVGIDRELRNTCLKFTIGIAASWFTFFVCRAFERFLCNWIWVALSMEMSRISYMHINPFCRYEVSAFCFLVSLMVALLSSRIMRTELLQHISRETLYSMQYMLGIITLKKEKKVKSNTNLETLKDINILQPHGKEN